eukprot:11035618-Lingulodinium_polyedra.AAC.1
MGPGRLCGGCRAVRSSGPAGISWKGLPRQTCGQCLAQADGGPEGGYHGPEGHPHPEPPARRVGRRYD